MQGNELAYVLAASSSIEDEPDGLVVVGFYYINDEQEPFEQDALLSQIGSQISPKHGRVPVLTLNKEGSIMVQSYSKKSKKIIDDTPSMTIKWFNPEFDPIDIDTITIRLTAKCAANYSYQKTEINLSSWKDDIKAQLGKKGFSFSLKNASGNYEFSSKGVKPKSEENLDEIRDLYSFVEPEEDLR